MTRLSWFAAIAIVACALTGPPARANGRAPATASIVFHPSNPQEIFVGLTFGALVSHDGGATWLWLCETAMGYGGEFDPDYARTAAGTVFATTFNGFKVHRDECTFVDGPDGAKVFAAVTVGPDDAVYAAASDPAVAPNPGDSSIYKSVDDGVTFTSASPGQVGDLWDSIEVAPSDPQRVYLTGYRFVSGSRTLLLFRSLDGGATFEPMVADGLAFAANSSVQIIGISKTDPDVVFARVQSDGGMLGDAIYRSTTGGASGTWTQLIKTSTEVGFVARANGDVVIGTSLEGSFVSHDGGDTLEPLAGAPHIRCLTENAAGEVWACTQNFGDATVADGAGVMKSTDLATWTKVLRYEDILAPVDCPVGTAQKDACAPQWCGLKRLLGITSTAIDCDAPVDGPPPPKTDPGGCCQSGGPVSPTALAGGLVVLVGLRRRRRRLLLQR